MGGLSRASRRDRYKRNVTEQNIYSDPYLLEAATGQIERLTNNVEVGESGLSFSPDGRLVAFSAPDDLARYSMKNRRVYLREPADRGGKWRKLGASFDGDVSVDFWSKDGATIFFNEGVRATGQVLALDVARDAVRQVTTDKGVVSADLDEDSCVLLLGYADGTTPPTIFTAAGIEQVANRAAWKQLTDINPQVGGFALGEQEEITWKSKDGRMVGGVLVKPVGFKPGERYPLIVAIHGGPASADVLGFNGGYGSQVYAGAGYMVLRPNYRGSTNYGEAHKTGIVGNYFPPGFDDIMTGVDHLIAQGLVDGSQDGRARVERRRPLVQLDPHAHRSVQGDQHRRGHVELDLDVRAERRAAQPAVLPGRPAAVRRLRRLLGAVAVEVHQEREDADDDPRG